MGDVNTRYKVNVGVDDAKWQEFVKSVSTLQSAFGGATKVAVESVQKIASVAAESASKQTASAKQISTSIISAQQAIKDATERRIKSEESAERLKFDQLKDEYKKNAKAIDDLNNAKKSATEKEAKAEIQIELNKAKELQQIYRKELASRPDTKKGNASDVGMLGTKREVSASGGGLAQGIGIGVAIEGFKLIKEHAEEAAKVQSELQAATGLTGKKLNEASEDAEKLGKQYKIGGDEGKEAMAKVASFTGATGEELKKQTEDAIILAQKMGVSTEAAAKMLGKASDPEVEGNLTKLGISLDKNATAEQRAAAIHIAAMNAKKGVDEANKNSTKNLNEIMMEVQETIGKLAGRVLESLMPAITAVMPIIDVLGDLLGKTLTPILDSLSPVLVLVANAITKLAPPITELISSALSILTPIIDSLTGLLGDLIPVVVDVVNTVVTALTPVFKALTPVITNLTKVFSEEFMLVLQVEILPMIKDVFVPLLTDLLVPTLMSLMPVITDLSQIMVDVMVPAFKILGGIISGLMDNILKPLIKFFSGVFVTVIQKATGVVEAVIGAIKKVVSVVSDVISLFGGGSKAEAAVKTTTKAVVAATEEGLNEVADKHDKAADALAKKKEKSGAAAAKKEKKSAVDSAKAEADEVLAVKKEQIAAEDITDRQAKSESRTAEMVHAQALVEITKKYNGENSKEYQAAKLKLQALKNADAKEDRADRIADAKKATEDQLTELELRATNENMSAKELQAAQYKIQLEGLNAEIALQKKGSEEEAKLLQQRGLMIAKHGLEVRKETLAAADETNKLVIDNQKEFLALQIQQLKVFGKDSSTVEKQLLDLEEKQEDSRYKDELEKRKEQGQSLYNADHTLNSLGEQLEAQHQLKLAGIREKAYQQDKEKLASNFSFLVSGYAGLSSQIDNKFFKPMSDKWFGQNEIAKSVFGDLTSRALKWIAGVVEKQALALAEQLGFIATSTATTTAAGAASAAAWTPAAIAASIATLGTADAAGTAAYAAAQAAGAGLTLIPHAEGAVFTSPAFTRFGGALHSTAENSPEMALPLSSSRAQSIVQNTFGFDKSLNRVVEGLTRIESHVAQTRVVLPMNNAFENARNNYLKSEDRRSV